MPLLNKKNLPPSPIAKAIARIGAALTSAQGLLSRLNQTCAIGMDAMLRDAIEQRMQEKDMPAVRVTYQSGMGRLIGNAGTMEKTAVMVRIFFIYATGVQTLGPLPADFVDLRERHIRWNLEQLKRKAVKPNDSIGLDESAFKDDGGNEFWWYTNGDQDFPIEHEVPFEVYGLTIPMPPGFACSRADISITVKNHATFNS